ncbi:diguanylate cyclase [Saccharospirillum salsuginis]|uniref:diguanylate cyclase n=1 Tax=Saccharospirillum salsuginis TaxID=418750 RepID=A0A918KTV6_9GAMM|nr:diguanylate cyclase [Saccharospirillum salsuginis]GGX75889.1 diguanylate cyclase [Saccharospirillum salsuginis]
MTDVQAKLDQLIAAYRNRLPMIEADLGAVWNRLSTTTFEVDDLRDLTDQLHGLKGSSGTFGLPRVNEAAARYEDVARDCLSKYNAGYLSAREIHTLLSPFHQRLSQSLHQAQHEQNGDSARIALEEGNGRDSQAVLYFPAVENGNGSLLSDAIEAEGLRVDTHTLDETANLTVLSRTAKVAVVEAGAEDDQIAPLLVPLQRLKEAAVKTIVITDQMDLDSQLALVRAGVMGCVIRPVSPDEVVRHLLRVAGDAEDPCIRIMIVDDQADVAQYYETLLDEQGMTVLVESDPEQLFLKIDQFEPDILLLDINMPLAVGPEIAQMLRMHERYSTLPILFLTGNQYQAQQRAGLIGIGTDDLLEKGMPPQDLVRQVRNRAQRARSLKHQVTTDGLSGLLNHRHVMMQARRHCQLANRSGEVVSMALIDLDRFKQINDTHGHDSGDIVIRSLSKLLRSRLRTTDLVGRYGGEEFILILPGTDCAQATRLVESLLEDFRSMTFNSPKGPFQATFSAGVSDSTVSVELEGIFYSMDQALYRAKDAGRDRVLSF